MNASLISISAQQSKHWCTGPLVAPRGPSCSVSKYTWVMLLTYDFKRLCRCWQNAAAAPSATPLLRRIRCHLFSLAPSLPRQTQPVLAIVCVCHQKNKNKTWPKTPTHPLFTVCLSVSRPCRTERDTERKKPSMFFFSQWKVSFSEQKILCHVLQWTTCWVSSAVGQRLCLHPLFAGNASVCVVSDSLFVHISMRLMLALAS